MWGERGREGELEEKGVVVCVVFSLGWATTKPDGLVSALYQALCKCGPHYTSRQQVGEHTLVVA